MRKTWEQSWSEINAACAEAGLPDAWGLRREFARREIEFGYWPEGEGLGSSDMNHILVGAWNSDEAEVRKVIAKLACREKTLAGLQAQGVDLDAVARLFAPVSS